MQTAIIAALIAAVASIVGSCVSLAIAVKKRKWEKEDRQDNKTAEVIAKLDKLQGKLDEHIRVDDDRNADQHRARILEFNTELLRGEKHTREEFLDVMNDIDHYERYCHAHPDYSNNRAVHAIANIGRVYDDRQAKNDFLEG